MTELVKCACEWQMLPVLLVIDANEKQAEAAAADVNNRHCVKSKIWMRNTKMRRTDRKYVSVMNEVIKQCIEIICIIMIAILLRLV